MQLKSWGLKRKEIEENDDEGDNRAEVKSVYKQNPGKWSRKISTKYKDYLLYEM